MSENAVIHATEDELRILVKHHAQKVVDAVRLYSDSRDDHANLLFRRIEELQKMELSADLKKLEADAAAKALLSEAIQ